MSCRARLPLVELGLPGLLPPSRHPTAPAPAQAGGPQAADGAVLRREGSGFHVLSEEPVLPAAPWAPAQQQGAPAAPEAPASFSSPQEAHRYTQAALAEIRHRLEELLQAG